MLVFTDSINFAEYTLGKQLRWFPATSSDFDRSSALLAGKLVPGSMLYFTYADYPGFWNYIFIVENAEESQYDAVINLAQYFDSLPDSILCIAGRGRRFHGFKNRTWTSLMGNIHLSALFKPNRQLEHFGTGFMILSVVSALEAVDSVKELEGKTGIKWVNDLFIDNQKICGALAHAQLQGDKVTTAEIGIGLNVEKKPKIEPSKFIAGATCIRDFAPECTLPYVFGKLSEALENNYNLLIDGGYHKLLRKYLQRSICIGKQASIFPDDGNDDSPALKEGTISRIGNGLELFFKDDLKPVTSGRLVL